MSFPQKVKSALWAVVDNMACNIAQFVKNPKKDFTRDRKLGFVQLIRFFLSMGSGCISQELLKYFYFLPDEVPSASAFLQQRANFSKMLSITSPGSLTFASRLRGLWADIPSLPQTDANLTLPATPRTLPPSIPQAADQKGLQLTSHHFAL